MLGRCDHRNGTGLTRRQRAQEVIGSDNIVCRDRPQAIHARPSLLPHFHRIAQHQREDLMAGRHLRQVHVRVETNLLDIHDLRRSQFAVEVLGNQIRIESRPLAEQFRSRQATPTHDLFDPVHERGRIAALGQFLSDLLRLIRLQFVVQVGNKCSQSESHDRPLSVGQVFNLPLPLKQVENLLHDEISP